MKISTKIGIGQMSTCMFSYGVELLVYSSKDYLRITQLQAFSKQAAVES